MGKEFFNRDAELVARELLGRVLIREICGKRFMAKIVETEAYYGAEDPASRARQNGDLRETMLMGPGTILVYGVHNNWLLNFVTGKEGEAAAVLIRAIEPLNFDARGNGPGLLTRALKIDKGFHKKNIINSGGLRLKVGKNTGKYIIAESFRIGVTQDLPKKLRFYINGNRWVSGG
jgi:DNA-3-methyladenine glycosylase